MQAPLHATPTSVQPQNYEMFGYGGARGSSSGPMTLDEISKQTHEMEAHFRQVAGLIPPQQLPETKQVDAQLWSQSPVLGGGVTGSSEMSLGCWGHPQVGGAPVNNMAFAGLANQPYDTAAGELERQQNQQLIDHFVQMLQSAGVEPPTEEGQSDFLQKTLEEIAKRCSNEEFGDSVASTANPLEGGPAAAAGGTPPLLLGNPAFNPWTCGWGPQAMQAQLATDLSPYGYLPQAVQQAGQQPPVASAPSFKNSAREEELTQYIRSQGQEYVEGQAEWSRQIAEVKSECLRELEKVKREKDEVERQARQEVMRLQQWLQRNGILDEDIRTDGDSPSNRPGPWAAGVGMAEHQHLQQKYASAEERIKQLEQYIKDQSAKQMHGGAQLNQAFPLMVDPTLQPVGSAERIRQLEEYIKETSAKQVRVAVQLQLAVNQKDEEIQKLKEVIVSSGSELRQLAAENQAVHAYNQRKLVTWEQGGRALLENANKLLSTRFPAERDEGPLESSRFAHTATKLSLNLTQGKNGEVSNLRRVLKDALRNTGDKSKRREQKAEDEASAKPAEEAPGSPTTTANTRSATIGSEDSSKAHSPASAHLQVPHVNNPGAMSSGGASPSNASSRDSSPGQSPERSGWNGSAAAPLRAEPAVAQVISRLASDLRQLIAMSHQQGPAPPMTPFGSAESSPRSCSSSAKIAPSAPSSQERARITQLVNSIAPARKSVAQNMAAVEKMLRGLDRDLRGRCEELFGQEELEIDIAEAQVTAAVELAAAEDECKSRMPLGQEDQFLSLVSLRHAQQQSTGALYEFVELPQKLKAIFDLAKRLGAELNGLMQAAVTAQQEVLPLSPSREADEAQAPAVVVEAVQREIMAELERGISHEQQLKTSRSQLHQVARKLSSTKERVRNLEKEIVDLHVARHNDRAVSAATRAQCLALMQTPAGVPQGVQPQAWWQQPGFAEALAATSANGAAAAAAATSISPPQSPGPAALLSWSGTSPQA